MLRSPIFRIVLILSSFFILPTGFAKEKNPGDSYLFYNVGISNIEGDVSTTYGSTDRTLTYDQGFGLDVGYGWVNDSLTRIEVSYFNRQADVLTEAGIASNTKLELSGIMLSGNWDGDHIYVGAGLGLGMASVTLNANSPNLTADNEALIAFKASLGSAWSISESTDFFVEGEFLYTTFELNASSGYSTYELENGTMSIFFGARQWF
jgi:hypothetical protein